MKLQGLIYNTSLLRSITYFFSVFLFCTSCKEKKKNIHSNKIIIATSANMQFVMKEIIHSFNQEKNIECDIIVGSSGKLTAKIKGGAPYHIFVAANMKYPQEIYESGLSYYTPKIYAYGNLVLWSINSNITPSINTLTDSNIHYIAIANPNTAPYGFAALEVLKNLNLYKNIKDKLVFGESISQTNQFITLQSAQIGFTSKSVVLSPEIKKLGSWVEIDKSYYSPIEQGVVIIKHKDKINPLALDFYHFLFSKKALDILKKYGYDIS